MSSTPRPRAAKPPRPGYRVVRDTREKVGHGWIFSEKGRCVGTVCRKLVTGDYTVEGLEETLTIDRKGSCSEFVGNMDQKRFRRELERMKSFELAVVLLEFEWEELARWHEVHPRLKKVPRQWKIPGAMVAKFWELKLDFPHVEFLFAGLRGREAASSLFKRAHERYA